MSTNAACVASATRARGPSARRIIKSLRLPVSGPRRRIGLCCHVTNNPAKPLLMGTILSRASLTVDGKGTRGIDPHR